MGSNDCMTLTYKSQIGSSGSDKVLTKDNSCKDAVGLCKANLGKLKNKECFLRRDQVQVYKTSYLVA